MATHELGTKSDVQGEHSSLAGMVLDAIKTGAVGGFQEAARSFFLPVWVGWRLSLLLVRHLRPITEPVLAVVLMFAVLLLPGLAAQALLRLFGP